MPQTLKVTSFKNSKKDDLVDLELPMSVSDRFDGHIVQGHVDGVAKLRSVKKQGNSQMMSFGVPQVLSKYLADKGSIAVNGISLTIVKGNDQSFLVAICPYTWKNTMLSKLKIGDLVNIEVDILAKYVERIMKHVLSIKY